MARVLLPDEEGQHKQQVRLQRTLREALSGKGFKVGTLGRSQTNDSEERRSVNAFVMMDE